MARERDPERAGREVPGPHGAVRGGAEEEGVAGVHGEGVHGGVVGGKDTAKGPAGRGGGGGGACVTGA